MVEKKVRIYFANEKVPMDKCFFPDVYNAIGYTFTNLGDKYGIRLQGIVLNSTISVVLKFDIPDDMAEKFNAGHVLKGIGKYLLKLNPDYYKQFLMGEKLLNYYDVYKNEGEEW